MVRQQAKQRTNKKQSVHGLSPALLYLRARLGGHKGTPNIQAFHDVLITDREQMGNTILIPEKHRLAPQTNRHQV